MQRSCKTTFRDSEQLWSELVRFSGPNSVGFSYSTSRRCVNCRCLFRPGMTVAKMTSDQHYDQIGYGTQLPLLRLGTCPSTGRELNFPRFEYVNETACSSSKRIEKCRVSYVETTSLSMEFSTEAEASSRSVNNYKKRLSNWRWRASKRRRRWLISAQGWSASPCLDS
jgi:hypothetical protein